MDGDNKWQRVPYAEHPDRCQGNRGKQGQCWNFRMGVSKFCPAHGGNRANNIAEKKQVDYLKASAYLAEQMREHGNISDLTSLNNEVALMKRLIAEKTRMMKDQSSFLQYAGPVADLVFKAEKLVTSCNRLNERLGNSLNQQQALQFAAEILEIIGDEVKDAEVCGRINERILGSLDRLQTTVKSGDTVSDEPEAG